MTGPGMFRLDGRVAVITGGAGMLAQQFAEAIRDCGGQVVLADVNASACQAQASESFEACDTSPLRGARPSFSRRWVRGPSGGAAGLSGLWWAGACLV